IDLTTSVERGGGRDRAEDGLALVRAEREVRRQADGEERGQRDETAAAGNRVDEAGDEGRGDEDRELLGRHDAATSTPPSAGCACVRFTAMRSRGDAIAPPGFSVPIAIRTARCGKTSSSTASSIDDPSARVIA